MEGENQNFEIQGNEIRPSDRLEVQKINPQMSMVDYFTKTTNKKYEQELCMLSDPPKKRNVKIQGLVIR